jgi:galactoside O-acetyltransferase
MSFYTESEIRALGLKRHGVNVRISRRASLHNSGKIIVGNHVRIDDFCVLSAGDGGIEIGDYVHIAVFSSLIGAGRINIGNFCGLSSRVAIYSSNEDYSGAHMTNPMVPAKFTGVTHAAVTLDRHVIIGTGSVILPGVHVQEGAAIGALSLVTKNCGAFEVYSGTPARRIGARKRDILDLEIQLLQEAADRADGHGDAR